MNKLFGLALLALLFLVPSAAQAANCFWFGGTGNINDTSKWFAATNGAGGACAAAGGWPNSTADNGTFDANSGGGTITRNVNWTIGSLTISAFTGVFGNSGDTASVNVLAFSNSGGATGRTFNMGASTWTCGIANTSNCSWFNAGTFTFSADTSTLVLQAASLLGAIQYGSYTYNVVTYDPDTTTNGRGFTISGAATIGTLNIGSPNYLSITQNQITTISTALNFTGGTPSLTSITALVSENGNQAFTWSVPNAAVCSYCAIKDTTITGAGSLTANNSLNLKNNTNVTINPPSAGGGGGGRIIGG